MLFYPKESQKRQQKSIKKSTKVNKASTKIPKNVTIKKK